MPRQARRSASPQPSSHAWSGSQMTTAVAAHAAVATPLATSQSLLFQLEIDGRDVLRPKPQPLQRDLHATLDRLDAVTRSETSFEARLARDVRYYHAATLEEEDRADVVILASRLAGVGYDVTIRAALGGGSGVSAFKHLSHEFLVVAGPPDSFHYGGASEYIVDPRFREQFDIPQTVAWYDELLLSVPEAYTGPSARLRALVRLLSGEMGTAFSAAGAVVPPWRSAGALLSKWLPAKARDTHVGDPALSCPSSPDAPPRRQPSSSVPAAALGFSAGFGAGFGAAPPQRAGGRAAARQQRDSSATAGDNLRTISAAGAAGAGDGDSVRSGAAAAAQQATAATASAATQTKPPAAAKQPQPKGRSDSEDDHHLSSPDTTLSWRRPSGRRGAAKVPPAAAVSAGQVSRIASAAGAAAQRPNLQQQQRRQPRIISREQVLDGSGGRSPPKAAAAAAGWAGTTFCAAAAAVPAHISNLRSASTSSPAAGGPAAAAAAGTAVAAAAAPQVWSEGGQYSAHAQAPPRLRSASNVPDGGSDSSGSGDTPVRKASGSMSDSAAVVKEPPSLQQLRSRSTSALSTKLASAGFISARAAAAAAARTPLQPAPQRVGSSGSCDSGDAAAVRGSTGTLPSGSRLPTSPPDAAAPGHPAAGAATQQRPPSREPAVEAPFWDQPLIRDFIATQQPLPTLKTYTGSDGYMQGEPRIRTVKMRGAGGSTHARPPRR